MRLIKFTTDSDSTPQVGLMDGEQVVPLASGPQALSAILHADDFLHKIQERMAASQQRIDVASIQVNAPIVIPDGVCVQGWAPSRNSGHVATSIYIGGGG